MSNIVLGQKVSYPQNYSPDVLFPVARQLNRDGLGLQPDSLPFVGADAWHAYEASCLTNAGLPVVGLLKIVYPCTSPYIVESKSLKLYLNSFNMERMGATRLDAIENMSARVQRDLSALLKSDVLVAFHSNADSHRIWDTSGFIVLEDSVDADAMSILSYTEDPALLVADAASRGGRLRVQSHLLRSNCRVTHQPDWGTVFIDIDSSLLPDKQALLAYVVSLRGENHFHEEICELIFTRLLAKFQPRSLMVCCVYTRRGGIDICPARATDTGLLPDALLNPECLTPKLLRQ